MENANRIAIKTLIDEYRSHYNVPVDEWRAFGKMMADYTDSPTFYLEAAGEALEDWNHHRAAGLCRRMAEGSVGLTKALAADELFDVCCNLLSVLTEGHSNPDEDGDIQYARKVLMIAEKNSDFPFWNGDYAARQKFINAMPDIMTDGE